MRKHYSSVNEYVSSIRESLKQAYLDKSLVDKSNEIEFFYLLDGKVKIRLSPGYTLRLRREQAIVLGFMTFEDPAETYDIENAQEIGTYKANLYRETNIHVYCDIVQPQIVGDKMVTLVAVVPCQKNNGNIRDTLCRGKHPLHPCSNKSLSKHSSAFKEQYGGIYTI